MFLWHVSVCILLSDESNSEENLEEDLVLNFKLEITDTTEVLQAFEVTKKPRRRKGMEKPELNTQNDEKEDRFGTFTAFIPIILALA